MKQHDDCPTLVPSEEELKRAGIGAGDYLEIGREFREYFQRLASLSATDTVLEIGCGIGRMATALSSWLVPPGSYDGFDVVPSSVLWCSRHITPAHSNFRFQWIDVANTFYNPQGRLRGDELTFPFADNSFDVVIAVSVFTHLMPESAVRYLNESQRVLRHGGRLFSTWFVWRTEPAPNKAAGMFPIDCGSHLFATRENPEAIVAFPMTTLLRFHREVGLTITISTPGSWINVDQGLPPYQDILVSVKNTRIPDGHTT